MTGIDKGNIPTITSSKKAEFVIKFEILNVFIFHRNNANKQPINNDSNTNLNYNTDVVYESTTKGKGKCKENKLDVWFTNEWFGTWIIKK